MANTLARQLENFLLLLAPLAVLGTLFQVPTALRAQTHPSRQHFACNVGYTQQQCNVATAALRKALGRYPADSLQDWTWILVRTVDWKQLLSRKEINPNDPAFSNLTKRVTFLDGSLLDTESVRGIELRMVWHMPVEDLLDFAIRHELAHAVCNERDESYANRAAIDLKNGTPLSCRATLVAENH